MPIYTNFSLNFSCLYDDPQKPLLSTASAHLRCVNRLLTSWPATDLQSSRVVLTGCRHSGLPPIFRLPVFWLHDFGCQVWVCVSICIALVSSFSRFVVLSLLLFICCSVSPVVVLFSCPLLRWL